ncbi:transposase [Fodinibius halophilus]|uniref:Transposase IS200-like domain-containing protein n=1 Tax=Fodinibius halophilus TaxID=1736908 RepID=A0A6M1T3N1_9BACT|nr:transposase [Fodinibius halophilus]NGP87243.1 hypothetical protein [Fodinibius halophilus]
MAFYRRKLPHWQPKEAEFFITFRLAGSLPVEVIKRLKSYRKELHDEVDEEERDKIEQGIFRKYEKLLDSAQVGPTWLENSEVAEAVGNAMHFFDGKRYDLYCYCIMCNHVHIVFKHTTKSKDNDSSKSDYPITKIMQSIKSYSALKCNKLLNRTGAFWQPESYDRVIRDQNELEKTIRYVLNNPVKAGLVTKWEQWPHSYCKLEYLDTFRSS